MGIHPDPEPVFPYQTDAHLWLRGNWIEGGAGRLSVNGRSLNLELGQLTFALFAVLAKAALEDAESERQGLPSVQGFRTKRQILMLLKRAFAETDAKRAATIEPIRFARYVHLVREKLRHSELCLGVADNWAMNFIEFGPFGYRISTPPENISLENLEEPRLK